ncbi:MAG TPA: ABC transporter substrate-binding protein [Arachnia sp.]|nr:ABC transporter substrate-binding protein [Arachnia sp.]
MSLHHPRRTGALVAGVLATAIALTACGASAGAGGDAAPETGSPSSGAPRLLPEAEGKTQYPLTLETPYGSTTLDQRPERIAVVGGLGDLESVLALDIAPVVGSDAVEYPWLEGTRFAEIEEFIDPWADSFPIETIAAAKPDLIVASTFSGLEDEFARLSAIAPVVAAAPTGDYAWDWRELIGVVGEATDLAGLAEQEIAETEAKVVDAAAAHPEWEGRTVSLIINRGQEYGVEFVNVDGSPAATLLDQLGFAPHPHHEQLSAFEYGNVSLENIGLVDADALIVARHGGNGTIEDATAWLEGSPLYQQLGAVKAGNVSYLDPSESTGVLDLAWALSYPNVLADRWTVDELTPALSGIID